MTWSSTDPPASTASLTVRSATLWTTHEWSAISTTKPPRLALSCPARDTAGNLCELIVLHFDDGRQMVIHAMPMHRQYEHLLPPEGPMT